MKLQQDQQNLQSVMAQKQQLDLENIENAKALEELQKATDDQAVYKHTGSILIKSTKKDLIDELQERQELSKTRLAVLDKQRTRLEESLKEKEAKIQEMIKTGSAGAPEPPK